jgi:hypothetical protein
MWTIAILVGVGALFGGMMLASARELRAIQREADGIAAAVFVDRQRGPMITVGRSYGYPTFQVAFASKEDLGRASTAGLNAAFQAAIQERFKATGSRKYPFDASRAIWFTSQEELDAISKMGKEPK